MITLQEGVSNMKAAPTGRQDPSMVIVARTGSLRAEGVDGAVRRA